MLMRKDGEENILLRFYKKVPKTSTIFSYDLTSLHLKHLNSFHLLDYCTLEEYLEQRELLEKPSEKERLLRETPRIMEDFIEIKQEPAVNGLSHKTVIDID